MTQAPLKSVELFGAPNTPSMTIQLDTEIHRGGAGAVYRIVNDPYTTLKLYHPETLQKEGAAYRAKVSAMIKRPPSLAPISLLSGEVWPRIAWPKMGAFTLGAREFVGFTMPMLDQSRAVLLERMMNDKQAANNGLKPLQLVDRLQLSASLAAGTVALHQVGYAVVDMKPENIVFHPMLNEVAFLDCDGFFVPQKSGKHFEASQVTPDYHAPEFANGTSDVNQRPEAQDCFALAVIIFRLLNRGIHPFSGVPRGSASMPTEIAERIKAGLYAYGLSQNKMISPNPTSEHETFPTEIRKLFDRAFESSSNRPSPQEWATTMGKFADINQHLIEPCAPGNYQHQKFVGYPCAACQRFLQRNQAAGVAASTYVPASSPPPASGSAIPPVLNFAPKALQTPAVNALVPATGGWGVLFRLTRFFAFSFIALALVSLVGVGVYSLSNRKVQSTSKDTNPAGDTVKPVAKSKKSTPANQASSVADPETSQADVENQLPVLLSEARECAHAVNHNCVLARVKKILEISPDNSEALALKASVVQAKERARKAITID